MYDLYHLKINVGHCGLNLWPNESASLLCDSLAYKMKRAPIAQLGEHQTLDCRVRSSQGHSDVSLSKND